MKNAQIIIKLLKFINNSWQNKKYNLIYQLERRKSFRRIIWLEYFEDKLITLASKLNDKESIYLINTFFKNKTEDFIAEEINVSKDNLYFIKKSCLLKMYFEFLEVMD